jgi:hypothetical protein
MRAELPAAKVETRAKGRNGCDRNVTLCLLASGKPSRSGYHASSNASSDIEVDAPISAALSGSSNAQAKLNGDSRHLRVRESSAGDVEGAGASSGYLWAR